MGSIATSAAGWSKLILMFAVPCVAIGLLRMIFIPEKYNVDGAVNTENKEEKLKVSDVAALVKTNKFILIISLMTFIFNFVVNMGVQVYYFKYIVGDVRKMALTAVITFVSIPLAFVFPQLLKKNGGSEIDGIRFSYIRIRIFPEWNCRIQYGTFDVGLFLHRNRYSACIYVDCPADHPVCRL